MNLNFNLGLIKNFLNKVITLTANSKNKLPIIFFIFYIINF